jgi:hypothetical protein
MKYLYEVIVKQSNRAEPYSFGNYAKKKDAQSMKRVFIAVWKTGFLFLAYKVKCKVSIKRSKVYNGQG